jgi:hypothetical protein
MIVVLGQFVAASGALGLSLQGLALDMMMQ